MRPDMDKVIVERPRPGSSRHVPRRMRRLDPKSIALTDDEDDRFPSRLGHGRAASLAGPKWLNENLRPLQRYLAGQVGRPWSKVWSEISQNVRADNTVQQHVRDHIEDFVAYRTFLKNAQVFVTDRFGRPSLLARESYVLLYVDPCTGLLCRNKAHRGLWRARKRIADASKARQLALRMRVLAPDRQLHLLDDGNWWEVMLARMPRGPVSPQPVDVVERAGLNSLPRAARYDRENVYAVAKRPLSRREIKTLGLRR